jgi:uncharacterized protein YjiS (DUF1127 family)
MMQDINNIRFIYASTKLRLSFTHRLAVARIGAETMAHLAFPLSNSAGAAAGFAGWIARAFLTLELALQVRKERRSLQQLGDAGLKDIGLTRADVAAEWHRSFWDVPVDRLR